MRIQFDHGSLRLHVDPGDPLHAEALETWREADALTRVCIDALPPREADATCRQLAETATHALTAGRDDLVIGGFQTVKRRLRNSDQVMRATIFNDAIAIFLACLGAGLAAGGFWTWAEPSAPWNLLPRGFDLTVNYVLLILGWTGFTLVGFSVGWLFLVVATVRVLDSAGVVKQSVSLRQRKAHFAYNALVCLIIVMVLFFFGGFAKISAELSEQLTSAPWAVLLGLVAGMAEPALSERIRGFLNLS